MALLVETHVPLNYLELLKNYQLKLQKGMEKNLLEYFKSLGEDTQKIKLMESFSHGTLMTNYVQKGLVVSTVGFNSLEKIQCCSLF